MRILITTGGSGGHIFPSLGLADQLVGHEIHFAGGNLKDNSYFEKRRYPYTSIPSATFSLKAPLSLLKGSFLICKGVKMSLSLLKKEKPDLVIGFGSFHTLPLLIGALILHIPIVLHEANAHPGKVNRLFAPFSEFVGLQFPEAASYLKGITLEAPLPLRSGFLKSDPLEKEEARKNLGLDPKLKTLLIFGGSFGAASINEEIEKLLPHLSKTQIIHLTGSSQNYERIAKQYEKFALKSFVAPFYHDMHNLYSAADLVISRAGASTIAEIVHFKLPSILIPYPFATNNHQEKNALWLSKKIGGAVMLNNGDIKADLKPLILKLLESQELDKMKNALENLKNQTDPYGFKKLIERI